MNRITLGRRELLAAAAAIVTGSVAGCAGATATQLATDVQLVASGVAAAVTDVAAIPGVPAATVAQIQGYLTTVQTDAAQVASATASAGANVVQEIATGVQAIAGIVLPLTGLPAPVVVIIDAAESLLPAILAAAGVSGATAATSKYTPDQARLILRAAAVKQ